MAEMRNAFREWFKARGGHMPCLVAEQTEIFEAGWLAREVAAQQLAEADGGTTRPPCQWTEDDLDGKWDTACGEAFVFIEGGPADNDVKFCCYCGGTVVVVPAPAA